MRYELEIGRTRAEQRRSPQGIEYSLALGKEVVELLCTVSPESGLLAEADDRRGWTLSNGHSLLWKVRALTPVEHDWKDVIHLTLSFDWHLAATGLPSLVSFAVNKGLVLRDRQKPDGLLWHPAMLCHTEKFRCRERAAQLTQEILRKVRGIRTLMKMADWLEYRDAGSTARTWGYAAYAVVLTRRSIEETLEERATEFQKVLSSLLVSDECIEYREHGFWVRSVAGRWRIYFCLEAYGHNPTMTAHMDASDSRFDENPGVLTCEPLRRPGTQRLLRSTRELCGKAEASPIMRRMGLRNMMVWYESPGERLAYSVQIEKRLREIGLSVRYDTSNRYAGSVLKLVDVEEDNLGEVNTETGCLYLGEEEFEFIYPSVNKAVVGGIDYFSLLNLISPRQCKVIADDLKRIAWLIVHDSASPDVHKYLLDKSLYIFASQKEREDLSAFDITPEEFLMKYRKRFLTFLTFIIEWFSMRDRSAGDHRGVNIMGL